MIEWKYSSTEKIFETEEKNGVPFLSFEALNKTGLVKNGFSTRFGGASKGKFATMNFSYTRGDDPEDVLENFTRMAGALGVDRDRMVVSWQTHTVNVRRVGEDDAGKGVIRDRDYRDVDGLITDVPGLTLVTFYADCVPLYILDTEHKAIGLSHSGWRGTMNRMGAVTLKEMAKAFSTRPEACLVCIGPCICGDCYEVGEEVRAAFAESFGEKESSGFFMPGRCTGKYQLDLRRANLEVFRRAGVPEGNIVITNICTRCNNKALFSHRVMGEERGNLAAFLCLI